MTRCREIRNRSSLIRRHEQGWTPGPPGTPTHNSALGTTSLAGVLAAKAALAVEDTGTWCERALAAGASVTIQFLAVDPFTTIYRDLRDFTRVGAR
ncbi:MAG TPA: hypothetical protein VE687_10415 [Stellaceae bacterium]|nr:hypothetical protein [Stellaceae bacterium]